MYLGPRVLAASLWAASFALLLAGSLANGGVALDLYMWCIFLSTAALGMSIWVTFEILLTRESDRNAQMTADAVGEAVRELTDGGYLRAVTPTRRGT